MGHHTVVSIIHQLDGFYMLVDKVKGLLSDWPTNRLTGRLPQWTQLHKSLIANTHRAEAPGVGDSQGMGLRSVWVPADVISSLLGLFILQCVSAAAACLSVCFN